MLRKGGITFLCGPHLCSPIPSHFWKQWVVLEFGVAKASQSQHLWC